MDLRSLNGGTVEEKDWLNPVVGTITASAVEAGQLLLKDPVSTLSTRVGGGAYAYQSGTLNPIYTLGAAYSDVSTANVTGGIIPTSQLQIGNTFEIYMSGQFLESPTSAGALQFYPSFSPNIVTLGSNFLIELLIPFDSVGSSKAFEFRCVFRVIAFTDDTIQCQVSYNAAAGGATASKVTIYSDPTPNTVFTSSRETNDVLVLKVFSYAATTINLTRTQYYVRQIC
jgi:hypothetical protein